MASEAHDLLPFHVLFSWLRSVGELQSHDAGKYQSRAGKPGDADGFAIRYETKQKRPGSTGSRPNGIGCPHRDLFLGDPKQKAASQYEGERHDHTDEALPFQLN